MSALLQAFDHLYEVIAALSVLVVCGAAMVRPNAPLRAAAAIQLIDVFAIAVLSPLLEPRDGFHLVDLKAVVVLAAYATITMRWRDRWIVILTGLQGFAVFIHLADALDGAITRSSNGLILNAIGWAMLSCLAVVTSVDWARRWDFGDRADIS